MSHALRVAIGLLLRRVSVFCSDLALVGLEPSSEKSESTSGAVLPSRHTRSAVMRMSSSTAAVAKCVRIDSTGLGPSANAVMGRSMRKNTERPMRDCRLRSLPRATMTATTVLRIANR